MPNTSADWLPGARREALAMGKNWYTLMSAKKTAWNISEQALSALNEANTEAEAAVAACENVETRTKVASTRCKTAMKALKTLMRDYKKRYFLQPPLADTDIVALGLQLRDTHRTVLGAPVDQMRGETFLAGRHELGLRLIFLTGSMADKRNKGFRIYYMLVPAGTPPPTAPEQFAESFFTRRRKDLVVFPYDASGKEAWFCVQIENDGKKGPWGPIFSGGLVP